VHVSFSPSCITAAGELWNNRGKLTKIKRKNKNQIFPKKVKKKEKKKKIQQLGQI
jgi:hypothetical protein